MSGLPGNGSPCEAAGPPRAKDRTKGRRLATATDLDEPALAEALDELKWEPRLVADARDYASP